MGERLRNQIMNHNLHNRDFYAWTQQQARLLEARRFDALDLPNLQEEIKSMGASERRELYSRFFVLIHHLLKWQLQPEERSTRWKSTLVEQRDQLEIVFNQSPSLRRFCEDALLDAYPRSRRKAAVETGFALSDFPESCPYTVSQVLAIDFYPDC